MSGSDPRRVAAALALLAVVPAGAAAQVRTRDPAPPPPAPRAPGVVYQQDRNGSYTITYLPARRALLGVTASVEPQPTDSLGALLTGVTPGGPADRAGLRSGDIVARLDGVAVYQVPRGGEPPRGLMTLHAPAGLRLIEVAARLAPNDTVAVEYRRGNVRRTTTLVTAPAPAPGRFEFEVDSFLQSAERAQVVARMLEERRLALEGARSRVVEAPAPPPAGRAPAPDRAIAWLRVAGPLAGLELVSVNPSLESYFGTDRGILVVRSRDRAPFGLRGGDVILTVDGREPASASHLYRILASYEPRETVRLDVLRERRRIVLSSTLATASGGH